MRLVLSAFRSNGYEATGDRPVAGGVRHVCVGFHHIIGNPEVVGNLKIFASRLVSMTAPPPSKRRRSYRPPAPADHRDATAPKGPSFVAPAKWRAKLGPRRRRPRSG